MGQLVLGVRSLFFKAAVFFIMAVLLAWALGGTLWPRATVIDRPATVWGDATWTWRLTAGGSEPDRLHWSLVRDELPALESTYRHPSGPEPTADGLLAGGYDLDAETWALLIVDPDGTVNVHHFPDQLELLRQMARLRSGLSLQNPDEAVADRPAALDPGSESADDLADPRP